MTYPAPDKGKLIARLERQARTINDQRAVIKAAREALATGIKGVLTIAEYVGDADRSGLKEIAEEMQEALDER
jgi:hypothetical protein